MKLVKLKDLKCGDIVYKMGIFIIYEIEDSKCWSKWFNHQDSRYGQIYTSDYQLEDELELLDPIIDKEIIDTYIKNINKDLSTLLNFTIFDILFLDKFNYLIKEEKYRNIYNQNIYYLLKGDEYIDDIILMDCNDKSTFIFINKLQFKSDYMKI